MKRPADVLAFPPQHSVSSGSFPSLLETGQYSPCGLETLLCVLHCNMHQMVGWMLGLCTSTLALFFDMVNQQSIMYYLWSLRIGGSVLPILTQFLRNRSQHVMVGKLDNVVSGILQGSVVGTSLFFLYTSRFFFILENKIIGYVDCFPEP